MDGLDNPEVKKLSELGLKGKYKGNVRRDLLRTYCKNIKVPKPLEVCLHIKEKLKIIDDHYHPILNPTEVTEMLYRHFRPIFNDVFGIGRLREFWDKACTYATSLSLKPIRLRFFCFFKKVGPTRRSETIAASGNDANRKLEG